MFKLSDERRVEWPVKVRVAEKGKTKIETFHATFEIPDMDTVTERIGDGSDAAAVREFLAEVIVGWRDVTDDAGNQVPCNEETKAVALRRVDVLAAVGDAFYEALSGGRRKN